MTGPRADPGRQDYLTWRALRPLCWVLLAVTLGVAALLLAYQSSQAQTTASQVQRALDIPYTRFMDPAQRNALLDRAKAAGADSIKTVAPWDHLEYAGDDQYTWGFMDDFIAQAEARGLKVHVQVSASPPWISPNNVWEPPRSSSEVAAWGDFIHDLVARYGTRISTYEMWTEPNIPDFWQNGNLANSPAEYAAIVRAGYLGAKSANSNVTIIAGSLSGNDIGYTNRLYDELRKYPDAAANDDFFDMYGVHPYAACGGVARAPDYPASNGNYNGPFGPKNCTLLGIDLIRQTLVAHGDAHKKLWLGEFGYNTVPGWMTATPDSTRARYLKQAYALIDARPYVMGMCWYSYYTDAERGFNIYDLTTSQETLTFQAFKEVASNVVPQEATISVAELYTDRMTHTRRSFVNVTALLKSSPQASTLPRIVVAVRQRGKNTNVDFPSYYDFLVTASGSTYLQSKRFYERGTYDYWVAYRKDGRWTNLTPAKSFRVK
jgi:polysaccharide biosynthesis protein PslG